MHGRFLIFGMNDLVISVTHACCTAQPQQVVAQRWRRQHKLETTTSALAQPAKCHRNRSRPGIQIK